MTHGQLVQAAEKWLLKAKGCSFAFSELCAFTTNGETPDAIGWRNTVTILVECKASRADFLSDKNKLFRKNPWMGMGDFRFYCCPTGMIKPEELPQQWGLVYVNDKGKARQIVGPSGNCWGDNIASRPYYFDEKCTTSEAQMMISALRRLRLRGVLPAIYENPFAA